jgi:hypothetical protein
MHGGSESSHFDKHRVEGTSKRPQKLTQEVKASLSGQLIPQELAQLEDFLKQGQDMPRSTPTNPSVTSITIEPQHSIEIYTPITSLTPLQTNFRNPNSELALRYASFGFLFE